MKENIARSAFFFSTAQLDLCGNSIHATPTQPCMSDPYEKESALLSWRIQPANMWTIWLQILCLCVVAWPWFLCVNECLWARWVFLKEARAALQLLLDQRTWTESKKASWEQWIASACCPALDFNSCGPFTSQQDPAVTSQQAFSCFLEAISCRFTC